MEGLEIVGTSRCSKILMCFIGKKITLVLVNLLSSIRKNLNLSIQFSTLSKGTITSNWSFYSLVPTYNPYLTFECLYQFNSNNTIPTFSTLEGDT